MVEPFDVPVIGDSNQVPQDDPQWTMNFYGEKVSDKVLTLKPTPGTELLVTLTQNGGGRGQIVIGDRYFAVQGAFLVETVLGVTIVRGTLATLTGKVGMVFNNPPSGDAQILVVDDLYGYVLEIATNTFVNEVTMAANGFVGGNSQAAFCAGRGVAILPGSAQYQFSALFDFKIWTGIDSGTATCLSLLNGTLKSIVSNGDLLYLWSETGFEVWQNGSANAQSPNPLGRILNGDKIGIEAPHSAFFIGRYAYWLGGNLEGRGVVYRHSGGGQPERISNHSTERNIADITDPTDGNASSDNSFGHLFYILTFREGNRTFCYDIITGLWHDRGQREPATGEQFALPFISIVVYQGLRLGMDYRNGDIWNISDTIYTDNNNPIVRERILSPIPGEADYQTFYQGIELFGQVGNTPVGMPIPNVMMQYSFDRGMTYSQEEWSPIESIYGYETRVRWVGLGSGYGLALRFKIAAKQYISWRMVRVRAE